MAVIVQFEKRTQMILFDKYKPMFGLRDRNQSCLMRIVDAKLGKFTHGRNEIDFNNDE